MKRIALFTFLMIFSSTLLMCQTFDIKFVGGEEWEKPHRYSITNDNEILVANTVIDETNSTGHFQITKLDFEGNILDTHTFGNSQEGVALDVVQSSEGDIFFLGRDEKDFTLQLHKFDNDLIPIWVIPIKDGGVYTGGLVMYDDQLMITCSSYEGSFCLMLGFDGHVLWEKTRSLPSFWFNANDGTKTSNGDVLVSGAASAYDSLKTDAYFYRISEQGDIAWESTVVDTVISNLSSMVELENGDYFGIGTWHDFPSSSFKTSLIKFTKEGYMLSRKLFDNDDYLIGKDILIHNELIFMLCTTSRNVHDIMLLILDLEGNEISRHNLGDNRNNKAEQMALMNDDQLLIIGYGVNTIPEDNVDMKFITVSDLDAITSTKETSFTTPTNLFPNPIRKGGNLTADKDIIEGAVFNLLGNKVLEINNTRTISTSNLSPGTYLLRGVSASQEYIEEQIVIVE